MTDPTSPPHTLTPPPRLSLTPQWMFLALAVAWGLLTLVVIARYHLNQPRTETSITINGQTYRGSPISLTLSQSQPGLFKTMVLAVVGSLAVASGDLLLRVTHQQRRPGYGALAAGVVVALFSLVGLLWGVVSLGVMGALLVLSSQPLGVSQRAWIASRYLSRSS